MLKLIHVVKDASFSLELPKTKKIGGVKQFIFEESCTFNVLVAPQQKGVKYTPEGDFKEIVGVQNNTHTFTIPKGFICDSTSLPWAKDGAGDAHDFGYCVQGFAHGYDKAFWDDVFYYLMLSIGMKKRQAQIRFIGVRLFGAFAYRKRRKEKYQTMRMNAVADLISKWGM